MREIKFRAWDKDGEKWLDEDQFYIYPSGVVDAWQGSDNIARVHLMQFTGLLDRQGKEIYEGDIIKLSRYWADDLQQKYAEVFYTPLAKFDIACPMIKKWDFYTITKECEVIGNIYENPELLEEKQ